MPEPSAVALATRGNVPPQGPDADYWHSLINEKVAAAFLDVTDRTLQAMRQRGDGPKFVRISSRCIKYRRINLREYSEARLRTSTVDPGSEGV